MFNIEYKIVYENCLSSDMYYDYSPDIPDYFDTVGTVYGDILITANGSRYGGIYDVPAETDYGDTVLDYWFEQLLEACAALNAGTEYTAAEPECRDVYLRFHKNGNTDLTVENSTGNKTEWTETVRYSEFVSEVISKSQKFIDGLCGYNARMANSKVVMRIKAKLVRLKKQCAYGKPVK
ncbi:MAG: hypothetical protein NC395_11250 [Prevotella sp.]|nr:hypothetical protein [Prevotella sp.]